MKRGAAASGDVPSAAAARDVLQAGGNAVDAAVAAAWMAAFTLPTMTGLGGAGLVTLRAGDDVHVLDFFAALPGRGRPPGPGPRPVDIVVDFEDVQQPFCIGAATVAVPGLVAGLWALHGRHGRMPMRDLLHPAIRAARDGLPVTDGQYRAFAVLQEIFEHTPGAWALVGDEDGLCQVGEPLANPRLAATLETLADEGPAAFYRGEMAAGIVAATEGQVTREDLAQYEPVWRRPLEGRYRGRRLYVPGAPSVSGPLLLAGLAHLESGGPLPEHFDPAAWGRIAEAVRHAAGLRTAEYEDRLFEEGFLEGVVAGGPSGSTVHVATIDAEGTTVSFTSTVGESAGIVAGEHGFALNNFLGEDDIRPRPGSSRAPGLRMMTGMCPTLLRTQDDRFLAVGSAGSTRIRSALLQVIAHVVDGNAHLQEAIGRPRIHVEGDTLYVEGFGRGRREVEMLRPLAKRLVTTWAPGFYFGGAQAVGETPSGFDAGAEVARRGAAAFLA